MSDYSSSESDSDQRLRTARLRRLREEMDRLLLGHEQRLSIALGSHNVSGTGGQRSTARHVQLQRIFTAAAHEVRRAHGEMEELRGWTASDSYPPRLSAYVWEMARRVERIEGLLSELIRVVL